MKIGAFSIFLPSLLSPRARLFHAAFAGDQAWRPPHDRLSPLPSPSPGARALSAYGLRAVGKFAAPVEALEQLDELLRAAPQQRGGAVLSDQSMEALGWTATEGREVMRALGFAPASKPQAGEPTAWRRRRERPEPAAIPRKTEQSPFAALAALKPAAPRRRRRTPRKQAGA